MLGRFRLVSARRERGGGGGGSWVRSCGWTDWPLEKVSWKAWEERSCLNGSFLSFFSPWPGQRLCMVIYECVGEQEGLQWNPPASLLQGLGWAEVPVIGLVLSYIHAHARIRKCSHTIKNPSLSCKDRGEDSVARQIWKMRCASHNRCQQFDRCLSGIKNPWNFQKLEAIDIILI